MDTISVPRRGSLRGYSSLGSMLQAPSSSQSTPSSETPVVTSIDSPGRQMMFRALMTIVALEPLVVFGVLIAVGMPWEIILALLAGLIVFVVLLFWLLVVLLWKPIERRYRAQPVLPGSVSKTWQSFAFGYMSRLNNCLTIIADERHLHMQPFAPMRWLGAGQISLPLNRIRNVRRTILPMQMTAELDGRPITGPAWCMELAKVEEPSSSADQD